MVKALSAAAIAIIVTATAVLAYFLFSGPHMTYQPKLEAYQRRMPLPPADSVPVESVPTLPAPALAEKLSNPLELTPENVARGQVYYRYYCVFCHGERGDGSGPVGYSYVPAPTNLRAARVQGMSDGLLLRASLAGTGHEPVLPSIVPREHAWYVLTFVRSLESDLR